MFFKEMPSARGWSRPKYDDEEEEKQRELSWALWQKISNCGKLELMKGWRINLEELLG